MFKFSGCLVLIILFCASVAAEEKRENSVVASDSNGEVSLIVDVAFMCGTWKRKPLPYVPEDDAETFANVINECDLPEELATYCVVALSDKEAKQLKELSGADRFLFLKNVCTLDVLKAASIEKRDKLKAVVENEERRQARLLENQLSPSEKEQLAQLPPNDKKHWLMNTFPRFKQTSVPVVKSSSSHYVDITSNLTEPKHQSPELSNASETPKPQTGPMVNPKLGAYRALGHLFFWTGLISGVAGGLLIPEDPSIGIPIVIESGLRIFLAMAFGIARQAELEKESRRVNLALVPTLGTSSDQLWGLSLTSAF
jgi:hypothetical protein